MTAEALPLSYALWDEFWICPYCGSDDLEVDLITEQYVCCNCEARSASFISDGLEDETFWINDFDRFDFLALFEMDRVGGD